MELKRKTFSELFELQGEKLITKVELTIDNFKHEIGDVITQSNGFDIMNEPENHDYLVIPLNIGFVLNGRIPRIR